MDGVNVCIFSFLHALCTLAESLLDLNRVSEMLMLFPYISAVVEHLVRFLTDAVLLHLHLFGFDCFNGLFSFYLWLSQVLLILINRRYGCWPFGGF